MSDLIKVTRSSLPGYEEYIKEIKDIWESHWLTNMGEKHKLLEKQLADYLDSETITLFTNGHLALELLIEAFGLTGEVITTPFTFISTTHAIVRHGLKPVFCDINDEDYTVDVDKIENLINEKTSAIMAVHVYGNICDVKAIEALAQKYNLIVIYDAAHAFGVSVNGVNVSSFGDASMFSFHATKVFNTIEGGAITTQDHLLKKRLDLLKNYGITSPETVEFIGSNAKMNEFQASMGICNLRHIDKNILKRKQLCDYYVKRLGSIKGIKLRSPQEGVISNYAYFPVVFEEYKMTRDEVFKALDKNNIKARKYFYPLTSHFACYKGQFDLNQTPVAKYIADRVLTLPLYPELSIEDIDRICNVILGK